MKYSIDEIKNILGAARVANLLKKSDEKEKNILIIVLAVIGAIAVIGGIVYAIWRIRERQYEDDYDLYDDLDYYYDESDHFDVPDDEEEQPEEG